MRPNEVFEETTMWFCSPSLDEEDWPPIASICSGQPTCLEALKMNIVSLDNNEICKEKPVKFICLIFEQRIRKGDEKHEK
jgi:hypothetical protein